MVVVDMGVAVAMTVAVAVTEACVVAMGQFQDAYTSHATVATQSQLVKRVFFVQIWNLCFC